jgi:hypothetical protein
VRVAESNADCPATIEVGESVVEMDTLLTVGSTEMATVFEVTDAPVLSVTTT